MVKTGRLSKIDQYFLEGNSNLPVEELAKSLDRSVSLIKKKLNNIVPEEEKIEKEEEKEIKSAQKPKMFQMMGLHERNGENVATVMTQAASELGDHMKKANKLTPKMQSAIHKPMG